MAINSDTIGTNITTSGTLTSREARGAGDRARSEITVGDNVSYDANSGRTFPLDPTVLTYGHFLAAYVFFNEHLFGGALPGCLITMQRKEGAYGFFHGNRFGTRDQTEVTDEIALNPGSFAMRDDQAILSTLVHEMTHLWQHHFGKPSGAGYHNREWAAKMQDIGLVPSDTGRPGGRQTGRRMTHYIRVGGPFDRACEELLRSGILVAYIQQGGDEKAEAVRAKKAASKTRYNCPECGLKVWAKPATRVSCDDCRQPLLPSFSQA